MQEIEFKFAGETHKASRLIGHVRGESAGPTLIFIGGIHGNEPTGVIALQRLVADLQQRRAELRGEVVCLAGNLAALKANRRYIDRDLNRIWIEETATVAPTETTDAEFFEQAELRAILDPFLKGNRPENQPLYFFDLHTTSAPSMPFIAINDQLINRDLAGSLPVPVILGLEEFLKGPILSMINRYGHPAVAFEAGSHDDPQSIEMHYTFTRVVLSIAGSWPSEPDELSNWKEQLKCSQPPIRCAKAACFFEIVYRMSVRPGDEFKMNPGYTNFDSIDAREELASTSQGAVSASTSGRIFMPLYQPVGEDGFFIIKPVPSWALWLSRWLRRLDWNTMLPWLPGIRRLDCDSLQVDSRIARFFSRQILHLLGYRRTDSTGTTSEFVRREVSNLRP